ARPSPLRLTKPPPTLVLLRSSAFPRSVSVMPSEASFCTSGTTRNCLAYPPIESTPARPGVVFRSGVTIQSCAVRRRSEEHTSELQSRRDLVCRLLLEKKKKKKKKDIKNAENT